MTTSLYDYVYTSKSGYSYVGQVVADTTNPKYNYVPGQTYTSPSGDGSYKISGTPIPTNAPPGAVYQSRYTDPSGKSYDSYHYDAKNNAYYDVATTGYNQTTGMYTPPTGATGAGAPVPQWSGIGLGNEYSYVNTAPPGSAPTYHVYGGGGTAMAHLTQATPVTYDFTFLYSDGDSYTGRVVDDGTYGYKPGMTVTPPGAGGKYTITAVDPAATPKDALAGYTYATLYHDATAKTDYQPSDMIPASPYYQRPVGYGGLGTETDYIQKSGGYYKFTPAAEVSSITPAVMAIPLPT